MLITMDKLINEIREESNRLNDLYVEVPDPDDPDETILVHKGFEDLVNE